MLNKLAIIGILTAAVICSCSPRFKAINHHLNNLEAKIRRYEKRSDIIFFKSIAELKSDTIILDSKQYLKDQIPIVVLGNNTLNFLYLDDFNSGKPIPIDSIAGLAHDFLSVQLPNSPEKKYLLRSYDCHTGRKIMLIVK